MTTPGTLQISRTAEFMAFFRAFESAKPRRHQVVFDPYAQAFLRPLLRVATIAAKAPIIRTWIECFIDRRWPGARSSGVARTKLIDQWTRDAVAAGCRQVVILGAGFDCRALRLDELRNLPVFELDRPALLNFKRRCLHGADAGHTTLHRVGVDFLNDDIAERLAASGFAGGLPTLFIWEGVTNYLDAASVDAVFQMVSRLSAPAARIIFTYVHKGIVDQTTGAPGLARLSALLSRSNETWTFGFDPDALGDAIAVHGMSLRADLDADRYRRLCWGDTADGLKGYEFYHVALADIDALRVPINAARHA